VGGRVVGGGGGWGRRGKLYKVRKKRPPARWGEREKGGWEGNLWRGIAKTSKSENECDKRRGTTAPKRSGRAKFGVGGRKGARSYSTTKKKVAAANTKQIGVEHFPLESKSH